jgi:hypothetical protein
VPRLPFRIAMFLSSYTPLFALLAYVNNDSHPVVVILAGVIVLSLTLLWIVMFTKRDEEGPDLVVKHVRPKDGDVLAYMATYLVPFFSVDLTQRHDAVVLGGFLAVLGIVYINSNMLFVNPVLTIFGYHAFEIVDKGDHEYSLITRREDLDPGTTIVPAQISPYIRLEVRR